MKVILGLNDFGYWLKKGKYHLANNNLADHVIKKKCAKEILTITSDDLATMIADWKLNGMNPELVNYFQQRAKTLGEKNE